MAETSPINAFIIFAVIFPFQFRAPSLVPVVGCRGGSRYFEGVCGFWKSERFNNLIVQKYLDSTPIKIIQKVTALFQNCFWFSRIHLCCVSFFHFHISEIYQDSTTDNFCKRSAKQQVLDPSDKKNTTNNVVPHFDAQ